MRTKAGPMRALEEPARRAGSATWFLAAVGALVSLALLVGGFYAWRVLTTTDDMRRTDTLLPADDGGRPAADAAAAGSFNYVLMGSDSRGEGDQGRSDVLMLAHVPPARDKVYLVSFPRDMWVPIPGRGYAKINAAYAYGGEALATRTLESLVGVRMDHAARIDFERFIGLTTELGGVTVTNKVASSASSGGTRYTWPSGEVTLQGEEALAYVRQRHGLPHGDLDRAERQRAVVRAILIRMISRDVLANPVLVNEVLGSLSRHVTVDAGLTGDVVLSTATSMRVGSGDDIVILQAPVTGFGTSPDGQSIDLVDEPQLAEMATAIRTGRMAEYAARYADQPLVPGR